MSMHELLTEELEAICRDGLYKDERVITTPQGSSIRVMGGDEVLNFCANNYLGLANHPEVIAAAKKALDDHGFGMASVRFICGTQDLHKTLERAIAEFFGTDDAILYSSCFDANGGLFETLLGPEDAVISDALNHASILEANGDDLLRREILDEVRVQDRGRRPRLYRRLAHLHGADAQRGGGGDKDPEERGEEPVSHHRGEGLGEPDQGHEGVELELEEEPAERAQGAASRGLGLGRVVGGRSVLAGGAAVLGVEPR